MTRARTLTGWHVLAMFVAFFGVIIAVNLTMAMLAGGTWTGLVVKNSYVASQEYNGVLAEAAAQKARGWHDRLEYADGRLSLTLTDADGQPVALDGVEAKVGRPAFEGEDLSVVLMRERAEFSAELALAPGVWAVEVTGRAGETPWRREARLLVTEDGRGLWE